MRKQILVALAIVLAPVAALAQESENTDDVTFDEYSAVSEQILMLTGRETTTLRPDYMTTLYDEAGFSRFNRTIRVDNPNTSEVRQWCDLVVKGTQIRREQVDQNDEAQVTQRAVQERCSEVYTYELNVSHRCQQRSDDDGRPFVHCDLQSMLRFTGYNAVARDGSVNWVADNEFGQRGVASINANTSAEVGISRNFSYEQAENAAIIQSVKKAGSRLKRQMVEIRQFQNHAPVVSANGLVAQSCLGRDTVELDLPFIVMFNNGEGDVRKGFVKARRIYDGCVRTPELDAREANHGGAVEIRPMESQIILGGRNVRPGYTMWEMPTIGFNIGAGVGVSQSVAGIGDGSLRFWPTGNIQMEQSVARKTGVSELHIWETVRFSFVTGESFVKDFNRELNNSFGSWLPGAIGDGAGVVMLQADVGVVKRWYSRFFFFGLGAGLNTSYNISMSGITDYTPFVLGVGLNGLIELGFQLTPRAIMDFKLGYRAEYAMGMLMYDGELTGDVTGLGLYHGPALSLNILYDL